MKLRVEGLKPGQVYRLQARSIDSESKRSEWSESYEYTAPIDTTAPADADTLVVNFAESTFVATWSDTPPRLSTDFKDFKVTISNDSGYSNARIYYSPTPRFEFPLEVNRKEFTTPQATLYIKVQSRDTSNNVSSGVTGSGTNPSPSAPTGTFTATGLSQAYSVNVAGLTGKPNDYQSTIINMYDASSGGSATQILEGTDSALIYQTTNYSTKYLAAQYKDVFGLIGTETSPRVSVTALNPVIVDTTAPATPATPTVSWVGTTFRVSFTKNSESDMAQYLLNFTANSITSQKTMYATGSATETYDLYLSANQSTWGTAQKAIAVTIQAVDTFGNKSAASVSANATYSTAAPSVAGETVVAGDYSYTASWTKPVTADYAYTEVAAAGSSGGGLTLAWQGTASSTLVSATTIKYVKIRHVNVFGDNGSYSAEHAVTPIDPVLAAVDVTPPSPVTSVVATYTSPTYSLAFNKPADADLRDFIIELTSGTTVRLPAEVVSGTAQTFKLPIEQNQALWGSPQVTITGNIYARDNTGLISSAAAISSATSSNLTVVPTITTASIAKAYTVTWTKPTFAGYSYTEIQDSATGAGVYTSIWKGTDTTATITRADYTARDVQARHVDIFGRASAWSTLSTVTPTDPNPPVICAAPLVGTSSWVNTTYRYVFPKSTTNDAASYIVILTANSITRNYSVPATGNATETIDIVFAENVVAFGGAQKTIVASVKAVSPTGNITAASPTSTATYATAAPAVTGAATVNGNYSYTTSWTKPTTEDYSYTEVSHADSSGGALTVVWQGTGNSAVVSTTTVKYVKVRHRNIFNDWGAYSSEMTATPTDPVTAAVDTTAPGVVTSVTRTFTGTDYVINFTKPVDTDLRDFVIILDPAGTPKTVTQLADPSNTAQVYTLGFDENKALWGTAKSTLAATIKTRDNFGNLNAGTAVTSITATDNTAVPTGGSVNAITKGYTVSWTKPAWAGYSYTEVHDSSSLGGTYTAVWTGTDTTASISRGTDYTARYVKIRHYDVFGRYKEDAAGTAVTPIDPAKLLDTTAPAEVTSVARTFTGTDLIVTWNKPADTDLNSFVITLTDGVTPKYFTQLADTARTGQTFTLKLAENIAEWGSAKVTLSGTIQAKDNAGNINTGTAITSITATNNLVTPASVDVQAQVSSYTVSWTKPVFVGYWYTVVEDSDLVGGTYATVWTGTDSSAVINRGDYSIRWVKVKHYDVFGRVSTASAAVSVTPINPVSADTTAPIAVTAGFSSTSAVDTKDTSGQAVIVTANWTGVADSDVAGYKVKFSQTNNSASAGTVVDVPNAQGSGTGSKSAIFYGVTGQTYYWWVASYDYLNNISAWSATQTAVATTDTTAPATPTGLALTVKDNNINATWTGSATGTDFNPALGIGRYKVELATDSGYTANYQYQSAASTAISFAVPLWSTTYYVKVSAVDTSGNISAATANVTAATGIDPARNPQGMALNEDPAMADANSWWLSGGSAGTFTTITDGQTGPTVLRSATNALSTYEAKNFMPLDTAKYYRLTMWVRNVGAAYKTMYLGLGLRSNGALVMGSGSYWSYAVTSGGGLNDTAWTQLSTTYTPSMYPSVSTTATYASGGAGGANTVVTSAPNTNIRAGQLLTGTGFAANTYVVYVSGTTVNFSPAASSQISGTLTFTKRDNLIMSPVMYLNYNNAAGSIEVNDIRIEEVMGPTLIQDDAITTPKIVAGAITASKFAADNALINQTLRIGDTAANQINLVAGSTTLAGKVYSGSSGVYNNVNTGFYLDGGGNFSLKDKLSFDGATTSTLTVNGVIQATSGYFAGALSVGNGGTMKIGVDVDGTNDGIYIGPRDYWYNTGNFSMGNGNVTWNGTSFDITGNLNALSGYFNGNVWLKPKNLLTANQASVETDLTGLGKEYQCAVARSTAAARVGSASLAVTCTGAGAWTAGAATNLVGYQVPVVVGQTYTGVVYTKAAATPRAMYATIRFATGGNADVSYVSGTTATNTTSGWTAYYVTAVAPATAEYAQVYMVSDVTPAANEVHYLDCLGFWEGTSTAWVPGGTSGSLIVGNNDIIIANTGITTGTGKFALTTGGVLTASDVVLTGQITATSGSIANSVTIGGTAASTVASGAAAGAAAPIIYRQDAAPATTGPEKSIWYDTNDNNKTYVLLSSVWTATETNASGVGLGSVENLNAQSQAQTGLIAGTTITGGGITLSGGGNIKGGQTDYNTGTGFFLGYSSGYKFSIGNPSTQSLTWDGTNLNITGNLSVTPAVLAQGRGNLLTVDWAAGKNLLSQNLSVNQNSTVGWYENNNCIFTASTTKSYRSSWSLRMESRAAGNAEVLTNFGLNGIPVKGGRTYSATASVINDSVARQFSIGIVYYDRAGNYITVSFASYIYGNTSTWTEVTKSFAAPAQAAFAALVVAVSAGAGGELHYVDNVTFTDTTTPQAWTLGESGYGSFVRNGEWQENQVLLDKGPTGTDEPLWSTLSNDIYSGADGGFHTPSVTVDPQKTYRNAVFFKHKSSSGSRYFGGSSASGGTGTPLGEYQDDNLSNYNPYYWYAGAGGLPVNEWYLLVTYVQPFARNLLANGRNYDLTMWDTLNNVTSKTVTDVSGQSWTKIDPSGADGAIRGYVDLYDILTSKTSSGVSGESTITVSNTDGIYIGMQVFGTGIGAGAVINSLAGTLLYLSVPNSGTVNGTVNFQHEYFTASVEVMNNHATETKLFHMDWCDAFGDSFYIPPKTSKRIHINGRNPSQYNSTYRFLDITCTTATNDDWYVRNPQVEKSVAGGLPTVHKDYKYRNSSKSGVYDMKGNRIQSTNDFKFGAPTTNLLLIRTYIYYDDSGTADGTWARPRIDLVDGTEPSIEELIGIPQGTPQSLTQQITGVNITTDGKIYTTGKTYGGANAGYILDYNAGTPVMELSNAARSAYLQWTGADLIIRGNITADAGVIGGATGWTIGASKISSGSGGTEVGLATNGASAFWAGGSSTLAPFRVTHDGILTATSGTIGGITLGATKLYTGTGTFGATNTGFYIDSSGNFSLEDQLKWDGATLNINGAVAMLNGDVRGNLGIGGSLIASTRATVTNKALTTNVVTLTTSGAHGFVATDTVVVSLNDPVFDGTFTLASGSGTTMTYAKTNDNVVSVAATGYVTRSNKSAVVLNSTGVAAIDSAGVTQVSLVNDGTIIAKRGTIGGWTLADTTLTGTAVTIDSAGNLSLGSANNIVRLSSSDATYALWAGNAAGASAPFSVTKAGLVSMTSGSIGNSVTIGGTAATTVASGAAAGAVAPIVYRQGTTPVTTGPAGSIWIDTANANKIYVLVASVWTASGETTAYRQATAPSVTVPVGSVWFDTDDGKTYTLVAGTPNVWTEAGLNNVSNLTPQNQAQTGLIAGTTITGGGITLSAGGIIKGGKTGYADSTNAGFFIGYDGTGTAGYKIYAGSASDANYIKWDASTLTIKGDLVSATGTFTGALSGGTISIGSGESIFKADSNGIYLGSATFATAEFSVTPAGLLKAESGTIGGINLGSTKIYTGTGTFNNPNTGFYADSAGQFSLKDQLSWNGTALTVQGNINAMNGYFNGNIWLKSRNIIGGSTAQIREDNASFETAVGTNSCYQASPLRVANNAYVGSACLQITSNVTGNWQYFSGANYLDWSSVTANTNYYVTAQAKLGTETNNAMIVGIRFYDANSNHLGDRMGNWFTVNASTYTKLTAYVTSPAGSVYGSAIVQMNGANDTKTVYVDAVGIFEDNDTWSMPTAGSLIAGNSATTGARVIFNSAGISGYNANESESTFSVLSSTGALKARSGTVGGWTLGDTTLTGTAMQLTNTGKLFAGNANNSITIDAAVGEPYAIWAGHTTAASAVFKVSKAGILTAAGATINGDITANSGTFNGLIQARGGTFSGNIYLTGHNLLTANQSNGSESGTVTGVVGVTGGSVGSTTDQAKSGTRSIALTSNTTDSYFYLGDIPIVVGQTYTVSVQVKSSKASGEVARLHVQQVDAGLSVFSGVDSVHTSFSSAGWTNVTQTFVALSGAVWTRVFLARVGASDAVTYWDEIGLWEGTTTTWQAGETSASLIAGGTRTSTGATGQRVELTSTGLQGFNTTSDVTPIFQLPTSGIAKIGGWSFDETKLYSAASGTNNVTGLIKSTTSGDITIFAGANDNVGGGAKFSVTAGGLLTATAGSIGNSVTIGGTAASTVASGAAAGAVAPIVYRQPAAPAPTGPSGSIWYDTDDSNKTYILVGGAWQITEIDKTGIGLGSVENKNAKDQAESGLTTGTTITGGGITLSGGGSIKGGQTDYNTGTGFFLGYSTGYKFSIGNSAGDSLTWNGTTLNIKGTITADYGTIGGATGWNIGAGKLYSGSGSSFTGVMGGTGTAFFAGATDNAGANAKFNVTAAGAVTAYNMTLNGGALTTAATGSRVSISTTDVDTSGLTFTQGRTGTHGIGNGQLTLFNPDTLNAYITFSGPRRGTARTSANELNRRAYSSLKLATYDENQASEGDLSTGYGTATLSADKVVVEAGGYSKVTLTIDSSLTWQPILNGGSTLTSTATSVTGTQLSKTAAGWTADNLIGSYVLITAGTGITKNPVLITDNGTTTIIVSAWSNGTPDATSTFVVVGSSTSTASDIILLQNSWAAYDASETTFSSPRYRKMPDGTVKLKGLIKDGTTTSPTVLFTLPAGYRPTKNCIFIAKCSPDNTGIARIDVATNGNVSLANYSGTPATYVSLDGINFDTV